MSEAAFALFIARFYSTSAARFDSKAIRECGEKNGDFEGESLDPTGNLDGTKAVEVIENIRQVARKKQSRFNFLFSSKML